jgi:hypothetical protein
MVERPGLGVWGPEMNGQVISLYSALITSLISLGCWRSSGVVVSI